MGLKAPAQYVREASYEQVAGTILRMGYNRAAAHYGLSSTALQAIMFEKGLARVNMKPTLEKEKLLEQLTRLGSVRLAARLMGTSESHMRAEAKRHDLDPKLLIDYSAGNNSNAKGRRAELAWIALRGAKCLQDRNLVEGSQADWDVDDADLGRVNVKSSRRYRYKAKTRRNAPEHWKHSMSGGDKCDHFVLMCYDPRGEVLEGIVVMASTGRPSTKTITVTKEQLDSPDKWTID